MKLAFSRASFKRKMDTCALLDNYVPEYYTHLYDATMVLDGGLNRCLREEEHKCLELHLFSCYCMEVEK